MTYGFTGHRPPKLGWYSKEDQQKFYKFAYHIIKNNLDICLDKTIIGMAQGWDMAAAQACFIFDVPYIAAVPYPGQELVWPDEYTRALYRSLLGTAQQVVYVSQYTMGNAVKALQLHNQWIVDHSEKLIVLWDKVESGGTWNCVKYARRQKVEVINVWKDWEAFQ
jgi:uncharacterized phage-like protein YoqJ